METAVLRCSGDGIPVVGICGGYQMLGDLLEDPDNVEHGGTMRGMGLLHTKTVFSQAKTRTRIQGRVKNEAELLDFAGKEVQGYEIHMAARRLWAAAGRPFTWRTVVSTACPIRMELCTAPIFTAFSTMAIWRPCW